MTTRDGFFGQHSVVESLLIAGSDLYQELGVYPEAFELPETRREEFKNTGGAIYTIAAPEASGETFAVQLSDKTSAVSFDQTLKYDRYRIVYDEKGAGPGQNIGPAEPEAEPVKSSRKGK